MERSQTNHVEQEVAQLISTVFIHLDDSDRQLMRHFGLTITQFWALVHLEDEEGRSLSELATLLICDKSNVTSIVDKMEEMGLAERKRGKAGDRRYTRVVLTPVGRQLRNRLIVARECLIESRLGALNRDILYRLFSSLQYLADTLQTQFDNDEVVEIIAASIDQSHIPV